MSVVILRIYSFSKYFEIVLFKLRFYTFESSSYIYLLLILLCWHSKIFQFPNFWLKSCTVIANHRLRITIWDKQISTSLLNPYWKILENSPRNFSEIKAFRIMKTRPENSSRRGPCHAPKFLNWPLDEFFSYKAWPMTWFWEKTEFFMDKFSSNTV